MTLKEFSKNIVGVCNTHCYTDEKYWKIFLKKNKYDNNLKLCKNYTEQEALNLVKINAYDIRLVKNQTLKICIEALRRTHLALAYIDPSIFIDIKGTL